jgi:hypothetical protein
MGKAGPEIRNKNKTVAEATVFLSVFLYKFKYLSPILVGMENGTHSVFGIIENEDILFASGIFIKLVCH